MFKDRIDGGRQLAQALSYLKGQNAAVLAIPRGGVVIGAQIAKVLNMPLDIIIPRKIGAPGNPELAIGAVAGEGVTYLKQDLIGLLHVGQEYLDGEIKRQVAEIKRRQENYLQGRKPVEIEGKTAVIVDDGIATGSTAIAAIRAVKAKKPQKTILAVPVAPPEGKEAVQAEADEVMVLQTPEPFYAVGQFYQVFEQTTDEEVRNLLRRLVDS